MAAVVPGGTQNVLSSVNAIEVPAFQAMPSSVSRIVTGQIVQLDSNNEVMNKENYQSKTVKREVRDDLVLNECLFECGYFGADSF